MVKCFKMYLRWMRGRKMIKLPENFESYGEARKSGFLKMKDLKDAGALGAALTAAKKTKIQI